MFPTLDQNTPFANLKPQPLREEKKRYGDRLKVRETIGTGSKQIKIRAKIVKQQKRGSKNVPKKNCGSHIQAIFFWGLDIFVQEWFSTQLAD